VCVCDFFFNFKRKFNISLSLNILYIKSTKALSSIAMDCADEEEERQNTYIEIVYGDGKLDESKKVGVYKAYPHARPGPRLNDKR
jgi:hypothetical protein